MKWLARLLFVFFVALLLLSVGGGPDWSSYLDWSRAFRTGDIFQLRGDIGSPMGIPHSQHAHGPGLIFALPELVSKSLPFVSDDWSRRLGDFRIAGWISVIVLWWAMAAVISKATRSDKRQTWFFLGVAFVGTHLGYYSFLHASESLSHACLALILYWLVCRERWTPWDLFVVSVLCAVGVTLRAQMLIYVLPAMCAAIYRLPRDTATRRLHGLRIGLVGIVPLALGLVQVALVNRWMTGEFLRSPYVFGGEGFHSLDLFHPQFFAVLFHPWHGLLSYHPAYLVAFTGLIACFKMNDDRVPCWLVAVSILVIVAHLYVQASWYCWWLGEGSFGMRGAGLAAVVLVPALAYIVARLPRGGRGQQGIILALIVCCVWSYILMLQGESNHYTYRELFRSLASGLLRVDVWLPVLFLLPCGLVTAKQEAPAASIASWTGAVLLVGLSLYFGCCRLIETMDGGYAIALRVVALVCVATLIVFTVRGSDLFRVRPSCAAKTLSFCLVLSFLITGSLFVRLAVRTQRHVNGSAEPRRVFRIISDTAVDEVEECYKEYLRVAGFEKEKASLKAFLDNQD